MSYANSIKSLFYITHIGNIASIFKHGILSHSMLDESVSVTPVYDEGIVYRRKLKATPSFRSLWDYANLYFQARNPMMYRVVQERGHKDIAILGIKPSILEKRDVFITDGNAASTATSFYDARAGVDLIKSRWSILQSEYWTMGDGVKRKIMAECLVPDLIPPGYIHTIFTANESAKLRVSEILGATKTPVICDPNLFFLPSSARRIGKISFIEGDMFFSKMQTLTVSVNLQGVMGKGLASRAKYQFPDVYVYYQDACKEKRITAEMPCIYKREASLDEELADESGVLFTPNAVKWFLLFATKRKWRDNSQIKDIEAGLIWLRDNFHSQGIQSIALPALGCGLGGLSWEDVGPLMCRYIVEMDIKASIFLPRETKIDNNQLTREFLRISEC